MLFSPIRQSFRSLSLSALFVVGAGIGAAAAQGAAEPSQQELLDLIRKAKPAPTTAPKRDGAAQTGPARDVGRDLKSGRTVYPPVSDQPQSRGQAREGERRGSLPRSAAGQPNTVAPASEPETPQDTVPTKPTPITEVLSFPWNTTYKLLMRFRVGTTDYYYVCSASSRGSFHLLTAGHCIFNFDPNDDGSTADAKWADEVWAWAAQTDRVNPFNVADHPYGVARATFLRSYTQWTSDGNIEYDYGLITLDRRMGDRTGWMGMEYGVQTASLNFNGYPTETPYVPSGELRQYPGYDANNVDEYTTRRIALDAYTYGGHSGGPSWRYVSSTGERFVQGIHSTSDRVGNATDTRIVDYIFNSIVNGRNEDEAARPPTPRPNLVEYVWATDAKDLLTNAVDQGQSIQVKHNIYNAGFATSGPINVDFYLSADTTVTSGDWYIGTRSFGALNANTFTVPTSTLPVPGSQPAGFYYVGWIVRTTTESDTNDNAAVIASETLQVRQRLLPPDAVSSLIGPKGKIATLRPSFSWRPAARATSYTLTVREGSGAPIIAQTYTAGSLGCSDGVSDCTILPRRGVARGVVYRWTVTSANAAGSGPVSGSARFKVVRARDAVAEARAVSGSGE